MPTDTFFRLPEEKQERLKEAIHGELGRAPFQKISINRIVKAAGISRGSYYQYFTDMDDLYGYVVGDYRQQILQGFQRAMEAASGDIFSAIPLLFESAMAYFDRLDNLHFIKNMFSEIKERETFPFASHRQICEHVKLLKILPMLDGNCLRAANEEEASEILMLIFGMFGGSVMEVLNGEEPAAVRKKLLRRLDWLQFGMGRTRV